MSSTSKTPYEFMVDVISKHFNIPDDIVKDTIYFNDLGIDFDEFIDMLIENKDLFKEETFFDMRDEDNLRLNTGGGRELKYIADTLVGSPPLDK